MLRLLKSDQRSHTGCREVEKKEGALSFVLILVANFAAPSLSSKPEAKIQIPQELGWYFGCSVVTNPRGWLVLNDFVLSVHMLIASQVLLPQLPNLNCCFYLKCLTRNTAEYTCITTHVGRKNYLAHVWQSQLMNHWWILTILVFPCHWKNVGRGGHLVIKCCSPKWDQKPIFCTGSM